MENGCNGLTEVPDDDVAEVEKLWVELVLFGDFPDLLPHTA